MSWRLDEIIAFLHVVEAGSITVAARRLKLSKSVVSKRITDLKATLGQQLLRRSTRRVRPTEEGRALYARVRPVGELTSAVEEATDPDSVRGRLRMAAPMSFGTMYLSPILARFARDHPDVELAMDFDDRMIDLVAGDYDLTIRIGRLEDSSLIARKLCASRRVVCCSPRCADRHGLPESIEDLARHRCIDYATSTPRGCGSSNRRAEGDAPGPCAPTTASSRTTGRRCVTRRSRAWGWRCSPPSSPPPRSAKDG